MLFNYSNPLYIAYYIVNTTQQGFSEMGYLRGHELYMDHVSRSMWGMFSEVTNQLAIMQEASL